MKNRFLVRFLKLLIFVVLYSLLVKKTNVYSYLNLPKIL